MNWNPNVGMKAEVCVIGRDDQGVGLNVLHAKYAPVAIWLHDGMTREQVEQKIGAAVLQTLELASRSVLIDPRVKR